MSEVKGAARAGLINSKLKELLGRLFGRGAGEIDEQTPLINMGADSLFLLQASQAMRQEFGVKVPFRLLLEELSTVEALAQHLDAKLPAEFAADEQKEAAAPQPTAERAPATRADATRENGRVEALAEASHAATRETTREATYEPAYAATGADSLPSAEFEGGARAGDDYEALQQIITQQLQINARQLEIMSQQLELLRGGKGSDAPHAFERAESATTTATSTAAASTAKTAASNAAPAAATATGANANGSGAHGAKPSAIEPDTYVPFQPFRKNAQAALDERQVAHIEALVKRFNERTRESKRLTQEYRPYLADSRAVAGFRLAWKEMVYPVVIQRAEGARMWDVDGNEYIDMNMGFGSLLFGHSPSFIVGALREQLGNGIQLGPQAHLAGKVAQLICELTGVERVAFCNSGTEAVMTALRLARAVTGRSKVALFEGCYHGTFDGVLVRGDTAPDGSLRAVPMAPGVPRHMIEDVLLLRYNSPESIEILKAHAGELAAVLIEPPRSRRPDVQPQSFLQELRRLTKEAGAALIFDEVVTGFRFHPGGAQALFGVQADLVTYGKAIGGGLPVAAVAGRAEYMDAVDGGMWSYGDASYPEADVTYFTGTYFKHPLIMPALWESLGEIKRRGTALQEELDEKTTRVVSELSEYFERTETPMRVARLGSLFRFLYPGDLKHAELFYYHLLDKGIYLSETRNCFLSTAHTDEDLEYFVAAVKESVEEMRSVGLLPGRPLDPDGDGGRPRTPPFRAATEPKRVPLTESQRQVWALAQLSEEGARAYNLSTTLRMRGPVDVRALRAAFQKVVDRHEALRATFSPDGDYQLLAVSMDAPVPLIDFTQAAPGEREAEVAEWLKEEARQEFDLERGPLFKAFLLRLEENLHVFVLTMHHIISDGWSFGALLGELKEVYAAELRGEPCALREPRRFGDYAAELAARLASPEFAESEAFWLGQFEGAPPALELPTDHPRPALQTFEGAQQRIRLGAELFSGLKRLSAREGCTTFMLLLGAFKTLLHHLTDQTEIVVGIPSAGQVSPGAGPLIGYCVNLLPLRSRLDDAQTFSEYLRSLKGVLADAYEHQDYPFSTLLKKLNPSREPGRSPLVEAVFNLDRAGAKPDFSGLEVEVVPNHNHSSKFDLTFDVTEEERGGALDCEYNVALFEPQTARLWMELYETLLREIEARPGATIGELREGLRAAERERRDAQRQEMERFRLGKAGAMKRRAVSG
jgi:glutamate-1-semialdehyde-2,1-aminomutase